MISLESLADTARIHINELRSRLDHAGIGHAGHGDGWESRVKSFVGEIVKENGGVVGGQVVAPHAHDDDAQIKIAERELNARLKKAFAEFSDDRIRSSGEIEQIRATSFRVYRERQPYHGPSGEYIGHGWRLCVAVGPASHPAVQGIIEMLPDTLNNFDIYSMENNNG
jgi:hypothetical protein